MANITSDTKFDWHSISVDEIFKMLQTSSDGLSSKEAQQRLLQHGPNQLKETHQRGLVIRFLSQFHNVLIYVLLIAGVVTYLLGHWIDSGVIFAVVLANAIIGFIQEGKAEDALSAIRQMLSPQAQVLRNGERSIIAAEEIVPGDVVLLQSGDKVPADLRLLKSKGLKIQEAALTGESVASDKNADMLCVETALADRFCMAYSGTLVTSGQGSGVVVATGGGTEIGRISDLVAGVEKLTTPLIRQMDQFGRWLTVAILVIAIITFFIGIFLRDYSMTDMFLATVGLAVAAIPEGLPAIVTITLAIGVQRMAHRNSIIRRLPAVETLGAVSVICSDKTGTLTRNEMTVRSIVTSDNLFSITGTGYNPHGAFKLHDRDVTADEKDELFAALHAVSLCNDSTLEAIEDSWNVYGDPMEGALLIAAKKAGLEKEIEARLVPRTDLIPFDSKHKYMATLHHNHEGKAFIYVKGAPEHVLQMCSQQRTMSGDVAIQKDLWKNQLEALCDKGQRVLAVATKEGQSHKLDLEKDDLGDDLVLLGLFGLIDPPREEAIIAVKKCQTANIRIKMITGDHVLTACAIARQLNLLRTDNALTALDLEIMSDDELRECISDVDVFARVTPEHKLRLVSLLQEKGHIVAMTGDGVNDAPALKRADVGVAMGDKGTEVAKDSAEMVLVDDNFASIVHAVEEGRTVYDNLKKSILFILPTNGGEGLTILAAIVLGFQHMPLTAVQILWVNMITAVTLALSLAFEPSEHNVMNRSPRDPLAPVLSPLFLWRIAFVSMILVCGTFGLFIWEFNQGQSIEYARTVAVNTLVAFEIFYLFSSRYIQAPVLNFQGLFGNHYVLLAVSLLIVFQLGFTYLPAMQMLFGTTAIDAMTWLTIIMVGSSVLFLVELEKYFFRSHKSDKNKNRGT